MKVERAASFPDKLCRDGKPLSTYFAFRKWWPNIGCRAGL
jgi:hypothetical protein